jgi:hypothetical protein
MKITIELTDDECEFYGKTCFLRLAKHAASLLLSPEPEDHEDPDAPWVADELTTLGEVTEAVRFKIVAAIFKEQAIAMKEASNAKS